MSDEIDPDDDGADLTKTVNFRAYMLAESRKAKQDRADAKTDREKTTAFMNKIDKKLGGDPYATPPEPGALADIEYNKTQIKNIKQTERDRKKWFLGVVGMMFIAVCTTIWQTFKDFIGLGPK